MKIKHHSPKWYQRRNEKTKMKSKCKNRWKKGISAYDLVEYYENFYHTKSNPQSKCNSKESLRKFSQK